jgi:hypothetical protein
LKKLYARSAKMATLSEQFYQWSAKISKFTTTARFSVS